MALSGHPAPSAVLPGAMQIRTTNRDFTSAVGESLDYQSGGRARGANGYGERRRPQTCITIQKGSIPAVFAAESLLACGPWIGPE